MKNKNVLITGATSGIGYEFAKIFAEKNYNLILIARNRENLKKTALEMKKISNNIEITEIAIDLFERDAAREIYKITKERRIFVDILINNAGQGEWGKFNETDLDREISLVDLNINSVLSLTKFYLKPMLKNGKGKILFVASSVSKAPSPYMAVYAATKAFILSFAEAISNEVKDTSITITALQPDATDTDFFHKAKAENTVTYKEKKLTNPEKIAREGYEALEKGINVVQPGFKNKLQSVINNIISDVVIANTMEKQMKISDKEKGRLKPVHVASLRERESINFYKKASNGDY
ncbi:SDR family NAD(P)-dependent oxidoreductase [Flavobacterium sp. 270]|uniref:SDR family NAD(P)-dependent oxidoreductase n=2 Tax=unclassified Flavobacterium TaxID=196869 RepID=UPI001FBA4633|nr:SDR family oxidoreductase [Flavobacterium sp. 270]